MKLVERENLTKAQVEVHKQQDEMMQKIKEDK